MSWDCGWRKISTTGSDFVALRLLIDFFCGVDSKNGVVCVAIEHVGRTSRMESCFIEAELRREREKGGIDVESVEAVRKLVAWPESALILPPVENAGFDSSFVPTGGAAME